MSPWEAAARQFEPPVRRWSSPLDMAQDLDPTIVRTPALELINRSLVDIADGREDRLIISMPPQEAKSSTASYRFPTWLLSTVDKNLRIVMISYADEIARRWGSDVKRDFETFNGDDGTVDLGVRLRADSRAAGRWQVEGYRGGMFCAGVAGSVTGRPADCVRGDSRIITDCGVTAIRDLHEWSGERPRVLSFNHDSGSAEWRSIVATRAVSNRRTVEVVTTGGRRLVCTPDHRLFVTGRGYIAAADLRPGMGLVVAAGRAGAMPDLPHDLHQGAVDAVAGEAGHTPVVLSFVPERSGQAHTHLRGVRDDVHEATERGRSGEAGWLHPELLHEGVLPRLGGGSREPAGQPTGCRGSAADCRRTGDSGDGADGDRSAPILRIRRGRALGQGEPQTGVRGLRNGPKEQVGGVPPLLPGGAGVYLPELAVRAVRRRVPDHAGRAGQAGPKRTGAVLLPVGVLPPVDAGAPVGCVRPLPGSDESRRQEQALLLPGVPDGRAGRTALVEGSPVPTMRRGVRAEVVSTDVLRPGVRRPGPLGANGWPRQLPLQGRNQLRGVVPADAALDPGTRWGSVPGVRGAQPAGTDRSQRRLPVEVAAGDSPPQRAPLGQPAGEPDHLVQPVSHAAPQVSHDTVSLVRELHGDGDTVYDLQVDGNRNFFADQVLVHNCLIIDDPIKDLEQAQSATYRERFQRFWQGVAVPRLGPGAKVVLIQTRWHEEDAAGWLIANEGNRAQGGRWRVINIPAQAEEGEPDPLGRQPGEYMASARGDRDWDGIKKSVGPYVWASLYQGRPAPAEGGLFKRLWWRYYTRFGDTLALGSKRLDLRDCWRFATIDLANSTRTSADFTVIAVWARTIGGDLLLLEMLRAKIGDEQHFAHARPLVERWRLDTLFVEGSQYGTTLVREAANSGVPITAVQAEVDKFSRALPYSAWVASGRVWLPAGASWLDVWLGEHASFPAAAHDDTVDTGSLAVRVAITQPAPSPSLPPPPPDPDEIDWNTQPL